VTDNGTDGPTCLFAAFVGTRGLLIRRYVNKLDRAHQILPQHLTSVPVTCGLGAALLQGRFTLMSRHRQVDSRSPFRANTESREPYSIVLSCRDNSTTPSVLWLNTLEHWSEDVSEYIAFEIQTRCDIDGVPVPDHIRDFVASYAEPVRQPCGSSEPCQREYQRSVRM